MGKYIAQAVGSIGDDVTRFGAAARESERHAAGLAMQESIAKMRDGTQRELAELRETIRLEIAERRAQAKGAGGGAGGARDTFDPAIAAAYSDAESVPQFESDRAYFMTGVAPTKRGQTVDAETGKKVLGMGPTAMVTDEDKMAGIRSRAAGTRSGIIAGSVDPQHLENFEKARTTERSRRIAFDPKLSEADVPKMVADLVRRRRAMEGKELFDIKDGTRIDFASGEMTTTEAGKAKATKASREGTDADRQERAALQMSLDRDQDRLIRMRADVVTRETPEGKEAIEELQEIVREKKSKMGLITPARMTPPKGAPAPGGSIILYDAQGKRVGN